MTQLENLQRIIRILNDKFFFHIDIDTVVPWLVIVLMYLLYKILNKYFIDKVLDSFELIKLIGIYFVFLAITMVSYIDFGEVKRRANPQYSFFLIILLAVGIVVLLAWSTRNPKPGEKHQKWWILGTLYVPILLLILTNGRILEKRAESLENLLPRSELAFLNLPGEVEKMRVGGEVNVDQLEKVEQIVNSHPSVHESAVVGRKDEDNLIKPYVFVSLKSDESDGEEKLKRKIISYTSDKIDDEWISKDMYPEDIEFVDKDKLLKLGKGSEQQQKLSNIIKENEAVADCRVIGPPSKSIACVVLQKGYSASSNQGKKILVYLKDKIKESNKISEYLKPRWIEFIKKEEMPKTSDGKIKRYILQKKAQNWSERFPGKK